MVGFYRFSYALNIMPITHCLVVPAGEYGGDSLGKFVYCAPVFNRYSGVSAKS